MSNEPTTRIDDLHATIRVQQEQIERLSRRLDELEPTATPVPMQARPDAPSGAPSGPSRRSLLTGAGIAGAVGLVAGVGGSSGSVAADNGDPLLAGRTETATSRTVLSATTGFGAGNIFLATDNAVGSGFPAAVAGYGYGDAVSNGVYGFSAGRTSDTRTGHAFVSSVTETQARSNLLLDGNFPDPNTDTYAHRAGEIRKGSGGELWYCAAGGTPGTWKKLAAPASRDVDALGADLDGLGSDVTALDTRVQALEGPSAPSFNPVTPFRAYDSRQLQPLPGRLETTQRRLVDVKDARDATSGAVVTADVVPAGATAIAYNLTITNTAGTFGFLSVTEGTATAAAASSINWAAPNASIANAGIVRIDGNRQIRVFNDSANGTDFIIDVTGFYA